MDFDEIDLVADDFDTQTAGRSKGGKNNLEEEDDQQIWNQFYNETSMLDDLGYKIDDIEANNKQTSHRKSSISPKQSFSSQSHSSEDQKDSNSEHSTSNYDIISKTDFFSHLKTLEKKKTWVEKAARR